MPALKTADGKPVLAPPLDEDAVNRQFAIAVNDDVPADAAPPRREEKPAEEKPRATRARTSKADKARTTAQPGPVKADYTDDAQKTVGGLWMVAASIPMTQPYALVVDANSDALVSALAEGAKHNATVRKFISQGGNSWMLQLASVGVGMGMQALQLMGDPEMRKQAAAATREKLGAAMRAQGITVPETNQAPEPAAA